MSEKQITFTDSTSLADLMDRWPQVIPLFLDRQMSCVGCSMAAFDSIGDAAANYHIPIDELMLELRRAVQSFPS